MHIGLQQQIMYAQYTYQSMEAGITQNGIEGVIQYVSGVHEEQLREKFTQLVGVIKKTQLYKQGPSHNVVAALSMMVGKANHPSIIPYFVQLYLSFFTKEWFEFTLTCIHSLKPIQLPETVTQMSKELLSNLFHLLSLHSASYFPYLWIFFYFLHTQNITHPPHILHLQSLFTHTSQLTQIDEYISKQLLPTKQQKLKWICLILLLKTGKQQYVALIKQEEEWFSMEEWRLVEEKMWWEGVCRMFVKWENTGLANLICRIAEVKTSTTMVESVLRMLEDVRAVEQVRNVWEVMEIIKAKNSKKKKICLIYPKNVLSYRISTPETVIKIKFCLRKKLPPLSNLIYFISTHHSIHFLLKSPSTLIIRSEDKDLLGNFPLTYELKHRLTFELSKKRLMILYNKTKYQIQLQSPIETIQIGRDNDTECGIQCVHNLYIHENTNMEKYRTNKSIKEDINVYEKDKVNLVECVGWEEYLKRVGGQKRFLTIIKKVIEKHVQEPVVEQIINGVKEYGGKFGQFVGEVWVLCALSGECDYSSRLILAILTLLPPEKQQAPLCFLAANYPLELDSILLSLSSPKQCTKILLHLLVCEPPHILTHAYNTLSRIQSQSINHLLKILLSIIHHPQITPGDRVLWTRKHLQLISHLNCPHKKGEHALIMECVFGWMLEMHEIDLPEGVKQRVVGNLLEIAWMHDETSYLHIVAAMNSVQEQFMWIEESQIVRDVLTVFVESNWSLFLACNSRELLQLLSRCMLPVRSTTILLSLVRKFLIGSLEVLPFSIMSAITVAFTEEAFLSHVRKALREFDPKPYVLPYLLSKIPYQLSWAEVAPLLNQTSGSDLCRLIFMCRQFLNYNCYTTQLLSQVCRQINHSKEIKFPHISILNQMFVKLLNQPLHLNQIDIGQKYSQYIRQLIVCLEKYLQKEMNVEKMRQVEYNIEKERELLRKLVKNIQLRKKSTSREEFFVTEVRNLQKEYGELLESVKGIREANFYTLSEHQSSSHCRFLLSKNKSDVNIPTHQLCEKSTLEHLQKKISYSISQLYQMDHSEHTTPLHSHLFITIQHIYQGELRFNGEKNTIEFDEFPHSNPNLYAQIRALSSEKRNSCYPLLSLSIPIKQIRYIQPKTYLHCETGLEVYTQHESYFFTFIEAEKRNQFLDVVNVTTYSNDELVDNVNSVQYLWKKGYLTNFQFLMQVNSFSSRSFNVNSQYYVFPWTVSMFQGTINSEFLSKEYNFRNLTEPVGALQKEKFQLLQKRYNESKKNGDEDLFLYGTFYSNPAIVSNFLVRVYPFTQHHFQLQSNSFDLHDRLFTSFEKEFLSILKYNADFRELIPEFYYFPEFLRNRNQFKLSSKEKKPEKTALFPSWVLTQTPEEFIFRMRQCLQSPYVCKNLPSWIDLIFGHKSTLKKAEKYNNLFHPKLYNDKKLKKEERQLRMAMLKQFGQVPQVIFNKPCQQKQSLQNQQNLPTEIKRFQPQWIISQPSKIIISSVSDLYFFYGNNTLSVWGIGDEEIQNIWQESIDNLIVINMVTKQFDKCFGVVALVGQSVYLQVLEFERRLRKRILRSFQSKNRSSLLKIQPAQILTEEPTQAIAEVNPYIILAHSTIMQVYKNTTEKPSAEGKVIKIEGSQIYMEKVTSINIHEGNIQFMMSSTELGLCVSLDEDKKVGVCSFSTEIKVVSQFYLYQLKCLEKVNKCLLHHLGIILFYTNQQRILIYNYYGDCVLKVSLYSQVITEIIWWNQVHSADVLIGTKLGRVYKINVFDLAGGQSNINLSKLPCYSWLQLKSKIMYMFMDRLGFYWQLYIIFEGHSMRVIVNQDDFLSLKMNKIQISRLDHNYNYRNL